LVLSSSKKCKSVMKTGTSRSCLSFFIWSKQNTAALEGVKSAINWGVTTFLAVKMASPELISQILRSFFSPPVAIFVMSRGLKRNREREPPVEIVFREPPA